MNKNVKLLGLSSNPSDYQVGDGNLAAAINVAARHGSIESFSGTAPSVVSTRNVVHIHKNGSVNNAIVHQDGKYYWCDGADIEGSELNEIEGLDGNSDYEFSSIGNTIITNNGTRMMYFLWSCEYGESANYSLLGNKLPDLDMTFNLSSRKDYVYVSASEYTFSKRYSLNEDYIEVQNADKEGLKDAVYSAMNRLISKITDENYISYPFLVRAAYRLYDGSTSIHTPPVLMIPSTGQNPHISITELYAHVDKVANVVIQPAAFASRLSASIVGNGEDISRWRDIIKSVDIFISKQFITYDNSASIEKIFAPSTKRIKEVIDGGDPTEFLNNTLYKRLSKDRLVLNGRAEDLLQAHKDAVIGFGYEFPTLKFDGTDIISTSKDSEGTEVSINGVSMYQIMVDDGNVFTVYNRNLSSFSYIDLPQKTRDVLNSEIEKCSTFYLLDSIDVDKMEYNKFVDLGSGNALKNLESREVMVDDYESRNEMHSNYTCSYNRRLNLCDINKIPFKGFSPSNLFCVESANPRSYFGNRYNSFAAIYIQKNGVSLVRCSLPDNHILSDGDITSFMFYPSEYAYKMRIYFRKNLLTWKYVEFRLMSHTGLNGAYCFNGLDYAFDTSKAIDSSQEEVDALFEESENAPSIGYANEIMTSEIDNPFVFRPANVEHIGDGKIIAMVPQAQALSQGQFGDYPMICFTTDGLWALSVNETGGWAAKQPFSREVVLNNDPDNILQLDKQIMFSSSRGLMVISGTNIDCISDVLDGEKDVFKLRTSSSTIEGYEALFSSILSAESLCDFSSREDITKDTLNFNFKEFISNASYLYDYSHQRIIVGNESYPFSFVYNMTDRLWTAMLQKIKSPLNSYPKCYAMTEKSDGTSILVDFSSDGNGSSIDMPSDGFILTRPIKLDTSDTMKTVSSAIVRGAFKSSHVDIILFGSRDIDTWFTIGSCKGNRLALRHGTPFKYFRVGLLTHLEKGESIDSVDFEFDTKMTNKVR